MTTSPQPQKTLTETIFAGTSQMATLMRSYDWSGSPLGRVDEWSSSLKTAVGIILGSHYPMFIWWGPQFINLYNDAYIPILGQRHPEALGRSAKQIWADVWEVVGGQAESVLQEDLSSWNQELLLMMERNGYVEETYFTFSYSPIRNNAGETSGVFCAVTEETERVLSDRRIQTLQELTTEALHARTIEETCKICAQVLDNHARDIPFALIYRSDGHELTQIASTTNLVNINPPIITSENSCCFKTDKTLAETAIQRLHQWILGQAPTTDRMVIEHLVEQFGALPGGAWFQPPHQAVLLPLARPGKTAFGFLIIGVSPHRQMDKNYQGFLDLVAGQITMAIANAQAHEAEHKRAETLAELDRVKTAFFNNVSHELRTPLTLILGPTEDALADPEHLLTPPQRERLELIHRNSLRLMKLVNTLLDFSRIASDRAEAVYEPTDLARFTAELASVFRAAIEQAGLKFIVDCPPLPEPVSIDREMWEKIVFNLLSNAFKFTLSGEITVRLRSIDEQVELTIADTGVGIPATELPNLFQRFYQIKNTKGRTFEGTGIGLSLVQELVNLQGGTIQVSSIEGRGSQFRVLLPFGSAHLSPNPIGDPQSVTSTTALSYLEEALQWLPEETRVASPRLNSELNDVPQSSVKTSPKILLVDDNADMRDYLQRLLSQYWQVETAANGAIALDLIRQQPPDLVLSDVMMPEIDGFQLLRALREEDQTSSIPVILLSARTGEAATIEGLTAGADDYLIKPFSARELIARVRAQLHMSQLRQAQAANRFKDEFLRTVTHELQAPLVAVLGWARLLQIKPFDLATTTRALATIERNAAIQAKLVRDLLDVSNILSDNLRLKPQLVDLIALAEDAVAASNEAAQAKNIHLAMALTNISENTILADGERLQQVILNLLDNAIKFTPPGGQVKIQLEHCDSDPQEIKISVADTGIGIKPEFLPSVFDRFTQAEVPSRHSPGGVGIGLAIARHLVELHHGTIEAASDGEGQGATFTIRLPFVTQNCLNMVLEYDS